MWIEKILLKFLPRHTSFLVCAAVPISPLQSLTSQLAVVVDEVVLLHRLNQGSRYAQYCNFLVLTFSQNDRISDKNVCDRDTLVPRATGEGEIVLLIEEPMKIVPFFHCIAMKHN